jgi:hypothetical protein
VIDVLKKGNPFLNSPKNDHVNLFYLKDKILDNHTMHEKYEALSIVFQQTKHAHFEHMLKQLIHKLTTLMDNVKYTCIVNDIV